MKKETLRMERITCMEQENLKLNNFNMTIYEGEVLGFVPLNHMGLDTLLELLQKNIPLHYGYVYYQERLVNRWGMEKQEWNRISIIRNEGGLAEKMTVADNIFVLKPGFRKWFIQKNVLREQLTPYLKEFDMEISADTYVQELTRFEKISVELLKAVVAGNRLVVLYDVGTFISDAELKKLHKMIRHYAEQGISFLYITAHFEETEPLCDRTAMYSNGKIIKYLRPSNGVGNAEYLCEIEGFAKKVREQALRQECCRMENAVFEAVEIAGQSIKDLSFSVAPGECLVIQDLDNAILDELVNILLGQKVPKRGEIRIEKNKCRFRYSRQIAVVREFPTQTMLFKNMNYLDNLCFCLDHRMRGIWINKRMKRGVYREFESILGSGLEECTVGELTEKQKYDLVYTRVLLQNPKVLFCVQPFKGAELSMRVHIWELLEMLLEKGIAVVILAVNLADSLALADRLIRVKNGKKRMEYRREDFEQIPDCVPWKSIEEKKGDLL